MNRNPIIRAQKEWWDSVMPELLILVLHYNYTLKELSAHFSKPVGTISAMLHRRGMSLMALRYKHHKEQK